MKAYAIDISTAQGAINWDKVRKDGIGYVWIKRSEGSAPDADRLEFFEAARIAAARHGIKWGPYHFARPTKTSCYRNAAVATLGAGTPQLRPMLDMEPSGTGSVGWGHDKLSTAELAEWARSFFVLIDRPSLLYFESGRSHAATLASIAYRGKRLNKLVGLWPSCRPQGMPGMPAADAWDYIIREYEWPWADAVSAIQFSSTGRVDGIEGDVDLDVIDVERCML